MIHRAINGSCRRQEFFPGKKVNHRKKFCFSQEIFLQEKFIKKKFFPGIPGKCKNFSCSYVLIKFWQRIFSHIFLIFKTILQLFYIHKIFNDIYQSKLFIISIIQISFYLHESLISKFFFIITFTKKNFFFSEVLKSDFLHLN